MQITPDSIVVAAPHQVSSQIDDEAALLNLETGVYYGLDAMGAYLWQCLREPVSVRALQDRLLEDYDVDPAIIKADLHDFLSAMLTAGLITITDQRDPG